MPDLADLSALGPASPVVGQRAENDLPTLLGYASNRDEWLRQRSTGIGASEIAVVLGHSRFSTRFALWAEKCGLTPARDLSSNEAVAWGNILEEPVAREWARRLGAEIEMSGALLRSTEHEWAICTLDATWDIGAESGHLEVKTAGLQHAVEWADGPPIAYQFQVQQQLLVTGRKRAAIACLIGGQELRWSWVERDETLIRQIVAGGSAFWHLVQSRTPPESDGSEITARAIAEAFRDDDGETVELAPEMRDICEELAAVKARQKELEDERRRHENALKVALGSRQRGAIAGGWAVSWKTQEKASYVVQASKQRVLRLHPPKEE